MATVDLRVLRPDDDGMHRNSSRQQGRPLNRIHRVREQQGVSLRTAARRMKVDMRSLRAQEQETADLKLSQLYQWQEVLEVPLTELLEETSVPLSRPVMERARMVRLMKTAMSIQEKADSVAIKRFSEMLIEQLVEIMPELKDVTAWHSVGQRRTQDELGRIAEEPVSTRGISPSIFSADD